MLTHNLVTCPCGSGENFYSCCGDIIENDNIASSPEQLMRSRYVAYVLKNENYLLKTWHKSTRPNSLNLINQNAQWKKLKVIYAAENQVHFVAFFLESINDKEHLFYLYEESSFIKDNTWFYLEGINLKTIELSKNMRCPCQSGKKFKRCCATEI